MVASELNRNLNLIIGLLGLLAFDVTRLNGRNASPRARRNTRPARVGESANCRSGCVHSPLAPVRATRSLSSARPHRPNCGRLVPGPVPAGVEPAGTRVLGDSISPPVGPARTCSGR